MMLSASHISISSIHSLINPHVHHHTTNKKSASTICLGPTWYGRHRAYSNLKSGDQETQSNPTEQLNSSNPKQIGMLLSLVEDREKIGESNIHQEYGFLRVKNQEETYKRQRLRIQEQLSSLIKTTKGQSWVSWFLYSFFSSDVYDNIIGELLFRVAKEHSELTYWLALGISSSFASWFSVTLIHVWMLMVRIRGVDDSKVRKHLTQRIVDVFFLDIERGIVQKINVTNPIIVGKSNKQFLRSYYGSMAAYDEALVENGDASLADALYRNLYAFDNEAATAQRLEQIVIYIRKTLYKLDQLSDEEFFKANWSWEDPPYTSDLNPSTQ